MSKAASVTLLYDDGSTRNYALPTNQSINPNQMRAAITAINASLSGGTAGGLETTFVSDEYDEDLEVGKLVKIAGAKLVSSTDTMIFGGDF